MIDWDAIRQAEGIYPAVWCATADELDNAGWGFHPRRSIPADWATRKPQERPRGGKGNAAYQSPEERRAAEYAARVSRRKYDQGRKRDRKDYAATYYVRKRDELRAFKQALPGLIQKSRDRESAA